ATHGAAIHTGDTVQITKLEFRGHSIVVDVNGGGRGKHSWREHLQIGMVGSPFPTGSTTTTRPDSGPPGIQPGAGSTVFLEFNKTVPDLSPDDLKQLLAPILDFSKQRSASVQWVDTLPPEMKKAIQDRRYERAERHAVGLAAEVLLEDDGVAGPNRDVVWEVGEEAGVELVGLVVDVDRAGLRGARCGGLCLLVALAA